MLLHQLDRPGHPLAGLRPARPLAGVGVDRAEHVEGGDLERRTGRRSGWGVPAREPWSSDHWSWWQLNVARAREPARSRRRRGAAARSGGGGRARVRASGALQGKRGTRRNASAGEVASGQLYWVSSGLWCFWDDRRVRRHGGARREAAWPAVGCRAPPDPTPTPDGSCRGDHAAAWRHAAQVARRRRRDHRPVAARAGARRAVRRAPDLVAVAPPRRRAPGPRDVRGLAAGPGTLPRRDDPGLGRGPRVRRGALRRRARVRRVDRADRGGRPRRATPWPPTRPASWSRPSPPAARSTSPRCSTPCRRCSTRSATAGVEAFLAYGTLLGAVREGRLLGHDSDADLGYVSRHTTRRST